MTRSLMKLTLAAVLVLAGGPGALASEPPAEWDGLVRKPSSKMDAVYVQPGASFQGYDTIMLDPVEVSFSKDWEPNRGSVGASDRMNAEDIQAIRDGVGSLFQQVFTEELTDGGYTIVDKAGHDTLRVSPAIVDLYINAPERKAPGRAEVYTTDAGRMTLVLELKDSVTGDLLARAVDHRSGRQTGVLTFANRNTNTAEARRAFKSWANILVEGLDDARKAPE